MLIIFTNIPHRLCAMIWMQCDVIVNCHALIKLKISISKNRQGKPGIRSIGKVPSINGFVIFKSCPPPVVARAAY